MDDKKNENLERKYCMSFFDSAQDQFNAIEYDLLNSKNSSR